MHDKKIYPVGTKVVVLDDYKNPDNRRDGVALVIGHDIIKSPETNLEFVDNKLLFFNTGEVESFGNWEIKPIEVKRELH